MLRGLKGEGFGRSLEENCPAACNWWRNVVECRKLAKSIEVGCRKKGQHSIKKSYSEYSRKQNKEA